MIVWITGASSGLGLHTAQALVKNGDTVIAGARSFIDEKRDGMYCLPLDVTDPASVNAFAEKASAFGVPDVLIQCAGILVLGPCEEISDEEYRRVIDTHLLGMVRVNRTVLPMMRERGHGRIVMFSSINGLMGIPFQGAYTAAKHAVEGYAECLQMEVASFGIQVTLIEPGDHRSGSQRCRLTTSGTHAHSPYHAACDAAIKTIRHDEASGCDPDRLGRRIIRLLHRRRMPFRVRIASADQHLAVWLHRLLPFRLNSIILRSYYHTMKK